jgi:hypothetical protein
VNPISGLPKWARIGIYGALLAVATDYFIGPTLRKNIKP